MRRSGSNEIFPARAVKWERGIMLVAVLYNSKPRLEASPLGNRIQFGRGFNASDLPAPTRSEDFAFFHDTSIARFRKKNFNVNTAGAYASGLSQSSVPNDPL